MTRKIGDYGMDYIILDMVSDVNTLIRNTWESMNNPRLNWSPIWLRLVNNLKVLPIGQMTQVNVEVEGLRTYTDFEVIDSVDDTNTYPALLRIDLVIDNQIIINFKKIILSFEDLDMRVVAPIDPLEW